MSGVGALHSGFFGIYLFAQKKERNIATTLLAFLLLVFAVRMIKSVSYYFSEDHVISNLLMNLGFAANLAVLPLFWLYLKAFLDKDFHFKPERDFIHLIPALIVIPFSPFLTDYFWLQLNGYALSLILTGLYLPACFYIIWSNINSIDRRQRIWILTLSIGMLIVWACYTGNFIFGLVPYITAPVAFSLVVYSMSYMGLTQVDIFSRQSKYAGAKHNPQLQACFKELETLLTLEKLYTDTALTLPRLASRLAVTPNLLSEAINKISGCSFPDYINKYRVDEAQCLLGKRDYDHQKISTIATETGFNSMSVFNSAFKKFTSMTPSEFRKNSANQPS